MWAELWTNPCWKIRAQRTMAGGFVPLSRSNGSYSKTIFGAGVPSPRPDVGNGYRGEGTPAPKVASQISNFRRPDPPGKQGQMVENDLAQCGGRWTPSPV